MAPSLECTANLFCSEVAYGGAWDDDTESFCEEDDMDACSQHASIGLLDPAELHESISVLVDKEASHMPQADYLIRFQNKTLDAKARQKAISWLLKVQMHYNFGALTVALAITYLDRYLSRHEMKEQKTWMLQLLCVACLSVAAKMEETECPLLIDLQVERAEYIFEPRTVQRMELLLMSTLDWRLNSVTPLSYVDFLINKLGVTEQMHRLLHSRINDLVLNALAELRFLEYRPSCIAVAATLCAIEDFRPLSFEKCKLILFSCPISKEMCERCFLLMDELCRRSKKREAVCITSIPGSPVGVWDATFSCDSESTMGSLESSPSVGFTPALKKRKMDYHFHGSVPSITKL